MAVEDSILINFVINLKELLRERDDFVTIIREANIILEGILMEKIQMVNFQIIGTFLI